MCRCGRPPSHLLPRLTAHPRRLSPLTAPSRRLSPLTAPSCPAPQIRFVAFLVFEACVGLYFPVIGTLKGDIVPEDMRSTIYNIYRLPLNVVVLMPLLMNFSISTTFAVTTSILGVAVAAAFALKAMPKGATTAELEQIKSCSDNEEV